MLISIDETLPCIPVFGQSCRNGCVVIEDAGISFLTEPKQDGDDNRGHGESHDHEDAGHRAFIMEEALREWDSRDKEKVQR